MIKSVRLQKLLAKIDIGRAFDVEFKHSDNVNTFCPFHENEEVSESCSCSVHREGLFNCKGCGAKGDVVDFYAQKHHVTRAMALETFKEWAKPPKVEKPPKPPKLPKPPKIKKPKKLKLPKGVLPLELVERTRSLLNGHKTFSDYIRQQRGLTEHTIERFQLGCDEKRITIPIFDTEHQLVNFRRYLPNAKPKMVSYGTGHGSPRLFPLPQFVEAPMDTPIILCEGEWDCLLLWQLGYVALTVTGGVSSWHSSFSAVFADRLVYIIYDVHDKHNGIGQRIAMERARLLQQIGAMVKVVQLDLPPTYIGGDITNYIVDEKHTKEDLQALMDNTPIFDTPVGIEPMGTDLATASEDFLTLQEASKSAYYHKKIKIRGLVAGKGIAPFLPPHHVSVEVIDEAGAVQTIDYVFDEWNSMVLSLIHTSTAQLHLFIKSLLGIAKNAVAKVTMVDVFNIEEVYLIPAIDLTHDQGAYVLCRCFYIGHGLKTNNVYEFEGYTLPDPTNQVATYIFTKAKPSETDIDAFTLQEADIQALRDTFQTDDIPAKFIDINTQLAEHVTKIYERPDLHTLVDLVYHSPLGFDFDGSRLRKGWLEALVIGDTRTGKGFVTEGLCQHYGVGEVVSGENVTLAGLVGGVQQLGNRWTLVWGKLPLADRRLIILDEAGSLSYQDISRLSRIRSEGVAEITKIISEKTTSRTRMIWLANPRPKGPEARSLVADYNYGIETVPELIGASEDIARFDLVLIVAHNEVATSIINKVHPMVTELIYTSSLCHKLLMWVWSRKPEHIVFEEGTEIFIMKKASDLANQFTPKIPLIQGEDVRFKLARLAASIAGRVFSTTDNVHLLVNKTHVQYAYDFIQTVYGKAVSGYAQLSKVETERATLRNPEAVLATLQCAGELVSDLVEGLLEHRQLNSRDLMDYAGLDLYQARTIISELVRHRALTKEYAYYVKKPAFKVFLQKLSAEGIPQISIDPSDYTPVAQSEYV